MNNSKNPSTGLGLGIAGLVLGIFSIPFGVMGCTFMLALVMGILGITLSAVGYSQAKQANAPTGLIIAALIISILGTSFALIRFTHSTSKSMTIMNHWKNRIDGFNVQTEEFENTFDSAFEEGFREEFEQDIDLNFDELENTLDQLERELNNMGDDIEEAFENLSEDEKARRLGRATGKALRGFVDELTDTIEIN